MRRMFTLFLTLLMSYGLFAQIDVTIGTGTVTNTNTGYPAPYGNYYNSARHQFLIPASEIIASGGFAGNISALAFSVNTANAVGLIGFQVSMGTTTATALGTWQTPVMTQVYSVASYTDVAGWNTHTFTTPYYWDGVSNLIIETCFNNIGVTSYTNNAVMNQSTTSYVSSMWYNTDTDPMVCTTSGFSTASQRPNIKLSFAPSMALDAGIQSINSPTPPAAPGIHAVTATLRNYGTSTLTSATVNWSVNGVVQTPYPWTGSLASASASAPLPLGSFTFPAGSNTIKVWSSAPNNGVDSFAGNDTSTLTMSFVAPLNGPYTIGGTGANYATFNAALNDLYSAGVTGPVIFNVASGTYTEQLTFTGIPAGVSEINTVTFKSATGDSTAVTLEYAALASADNWVVRFSGVNDIIFKQMTIKATGISIGRVFEMLTGTKRITISNCIIQTDMVSTGSLFAGIYSASGNSGMGLLTVTNNVFIGGYYSIYWYGSSTNKKTGLVVENNIMTDFHYYGIQAYHADSVFIRYNTLTNRTTSGITYALYVYYTTGASEIIGNNVHLRGTSSQYGITSGYKLVGDVTPMLIANNFVSQVGSTGTVYAIYLLTTNHVNVYHNSVRIGNGSTTGGRALFASSGTNLNIMNNSLANFGGGYALYTSSTTNIVGSDYNNLYTTGVNLAYWSTNRATLADWQLASSKDTYSISANPQYTSVTDLHSTSIGMWQTGTPLLAVPFDIDMQPRNPVTPCIGADEYMLYANDAGISEMTAPVAPCPGIADVKVKIKNYGIQSFTGATINWSVNGVAQTPFTFTGTLAPSVDQEVLLGTFNFAAGIVYNLTFYSSSPGSSVDQNTVNDTLHKSGMQTAMSGIYSIGPALTDHFATMGDAVQALKNFGVCGPIVINVAANSGPFAGGLDFEGINGSSSVNTIIFNGNGNVINETSMGYILRFGGNSYITIDNFQLIVSNPSNARFGILVRNGCTNLTFTNNTINLGITTTSSLSAGIVSTGSETSATTAGNNAQYLTITNNQIIGGYYGITLNGNSSYLQNFGHTVNNNIVSDFYLYGIYLSNADTATVSGNNLSRATRSSISTFYGIYAATSRYIKYHNNRIHSSGVGSYGCYPFYISTSVNSLGYESEFINNAVYNLPTTSTVYAYYFLGTRDHLKMYHNTVHAYTSAANTVYGIYFSGAPNNHTLRNNLVSVEGPGTGTKYCIYAATTSTSFISDNNVYYNGGTGGTVNNIGYWSAARVTLADWQLATSQDFMSTSTNPVLAAPLTGNITPLNAAVDNMGSPVGVMTDINNATRSTITPDIGAIEFTGIGADLALLGGSLASGQCLSNNDSLYITFANVIGSTVNFSTSTTTIFWNVTGPVNSNGNIILNSGTLAPATSMTVGGAAVNMSVPGVYYLSAYIGANSVNLYGGNDTLNEMAMHTIYDPFYVQPKTITITDPTQTVPITAKSTHFPGGSFYFSEVCQFRGASTGAPVGGWPTYMIADDYIEITGVPNSDLGGYTLEQWNTTALASTHIFPVGTFMSPAGTAIIAVGELNSSVPSPANFYYHGNGTYTSFWGSSTASGRILKDGSGNIVDVVGYYGFTFPATANVPVSEWSNSNTGGVSTAGIRLTGPDNNTGSNWVVSSATDPQNPNAVNAGTTVPSPASLTGFTWSHNSVVFATNVIDTTVGPWATSGTYHYIASYVTPCGTLSDTVTIIASYLTGTPDTTICVGDSILLQVWLTGTGPWTVVVSDGTGTDTIPGIPVSPFSIYVSPTVTTTYSLLSYKDGTGPFVPSTLATVVTVLPAPTVTMGTFAPLCIGDAPVTLTGGLPTGGTYSGPGVAAGVFDPAVAGAGTHAIVYTFTNTSGCSGSAVEHLIVGTPPAFALTADHDICEGSSTMLEVTFPNVAIPGVFFSEYIEGTSNNKAIEIFNGTPDTIALANYRIGQAVNGGGWAYWHNFPTGATLAPHKTWVMVANQTSATYYDTANADEVLSFPSVVHHNGNDARSVEVTTDGGLTWTIIDIIGDPDNNPGTAWPVAGVTNATADKTLIRKPEIYKGGTNWLAIAGTTAANSEYVVNPVNTFTNLGSHTYIAPPVLSVTYAWSNSATTPSITVSPVVTTTYTVTVTDALTSCQSVDTVIVTVNPAPVVVLGPDFNMCDTAMTILDAGAGFASYLWSTGATTQTINVSGATIGTNNTVAYTVTVTDANGCDGVSTVNITAINCSGIDEAYSHNALTFWPNPNDGQFFVKIKGLTGKATLTISSVTGQIIHSEVLNLNDELVKEMNLGNLAPGIYFVRLQSDTKVTTKQVIIK